MRAAQLAWLVFMVSAFPLPALAQRQYIEISGANFRPLPLAVTFPLTTDEGGQSAALDFDDAFAFDLAAAGLFQVLDRRSFLADKKEGLTSGTIQFARWTDIGADFLVKTQLSTGGSELHCDLRLFSVAAGREELKVTRAVAATERRKLAHLLADELYRHFTGEAGPFSTHLVYARTTPKGKDIWFSDWDGKNAVSVIRGGLNLLPALSPNGIVAYTSYTKRDRPELFANRPGAEPVSIIKTGTLVSGVAFSRDGKRIAWAQASGEGAQLWVADSNGSSARQLTHSVGVLNTSPSWSPDGKRLAFVSTRGGTPQIYLLSSDGSGSPTRLTFQGNYNTTPAWSPRGDLIAFTARDERNAFDLFTVHVETRKISRLTQDQGNNEEPSFSPNGRLVVFSSTRNGRSQLFVMTADGNNQVPLKMEQGDYTTPDWGN